MFNDLKRKMFISENKDFYEMNHADIMSESDDNFFFKLDEKFGFNESAYENNILALEEHLYLEEFQDDDLDNDEDLEEYNNPEGETMMQAYNENDELFLDDDETEEGLDQFDESTLLLFENDDFEDDDFEDDDEFDDDDFDESLEEDCPSDPLPPGFEESFDFSMDFLTESSDDEDDEEDDEDEDDEDEEKSSKTKKKSSKKKDDDDEDDEEDDEDEDEDDDKKSESLSFLEDENFGIGDSTGFADEEQIELPGESDDEDDISESFDFSF